MYKTDNVMIRLSSDEENHLVIEMAGDFPSAGSDLFFSLTALAYGVTCMMKDSQEEVAELGLAYMDEQGITFQGLLDDALAKRRMH